MKKGAGERAAKKGAGEDGVAQGRDYAFFRDALKHRVLAIILFGFAVVLLWNAAFPTEGRRTSTAFLLVTASFMIGTGAWAWRISRDREPFLRVGPEGIHDSTFGFIPWSDVRRWKKNASIFNSNFGYDLKKGVKPPRNQRLFAIMRFSNLLVAQPARSIRKQMIRGGADPIAAAFRDLRPDLEG